MHRHAARWPARWGGVIAILAGSAAVTARLQATDALPLAIDAFVFDAAGRPVTDLDVTEFKVAIDGRPRQVVAARYVYRGPGAEVAAAGTAAASRASAEALALRRALGGGAAGASTPLAEPSRIILLAVDESSFPRGAERAFALATDRLLDRFGPGDLLAIVTVPMTVHRRAIVFSSDRVAIREALGTIVGRGAPASLLAGIVPERLETAVVAQGATGTAAATGSDVTTGGDVPPVSRTGAEEKRDAMADAQSDPNAPSGERAENSLQTLARLLADARVTPGLKTVVLVTAGRPDPASTPAHPADMASGLVDTVEASAIAARAVVHVLGVQDAGTHGTWSDLERLARNTGGELVRTGRSIEPALDRLGLAVSGSYHLEVQASVSDRDGRPHAIEVTVSRPKVQVRTARRFVPRNDPPFREVAAPVAQPLGARDLPDDPAPPAARGRNGGGRDAPAPDPELDAIVARAVEYLVGYVREFRNVVAEEDYRQTNPMSGLREVRRLKSDFLLVVSPDGKTLVPFRDVFAVDGTPIRDREDRLRKLFLESPPSAAIDAAGRVQAEGARYNVVSPHTTANVPTMALTYLLQPGGEGVRFRRGHEETLEGVRALRVDFDEPGRPTVIRSPSGFDVPASGSFWIDPLTGRIIKTFMRAVRAPGDDGQTGVIMEMTVVFRRNDRLGLWVPAEMRESYRLRGQVIEGDATYSNFRTFQVKTDQEVRVAK